MAINEVKDISKSRESEKFSMVFEQMKNELELKGISYETFVAYYNILIDYIFSNSDSLDYSNCRDYAITLAHAKVIFRYQKYENIGYEAIISELNNIIRKTTLMQLNEFNIDWKEIVDYNIKELRECYVKLDEFGDMCSFLGNLIMAGIEGENVKEFAHALNGAIVVGINSDREEKRYRAYRFQVLGMINQLENPTKKDPTK